MNLMMDPVEAELGSPVETAWVEEEMPTTITTTLYDLIAAVRATVAPDDDALVIATVAHILRSRRVTFLDHGVEPDRWDQELPQENLSSQAAALPQPRRSVAPRCSTVAPLGAIAFIAGQTPVQGSVC